MSFYCKSTKSREINIADTNPDQLIQKEEHILNAMKHLTLPDTY